MATKRKTAIKPAAKKSKRPAKKSKTRRSRRVWLLVLVLGVLAANIAYVLKNRRSAEVPITASVVQGIGSKGTGPGQLDGPRGMAVGPDGSVFVADLGNARVAIFSADGSFKSSFGHLGEAGKGKPGEFNEPSGVAVAADGTVYVADSWNGRIQHLDAKGTPLGEWGGPRYAFYSPRNVAVDRQGIVYVADTGNSVIKAIGPDGKIIKAMGGLGSGLGQFKEVFGLAVNSRGEIFGADPGNKKIHKFSAMPAGEPMKSIKVQGWVVNAPFWPHLAIDSADRVYAVDSGSRKVWVYNSDLQYLGTIGGAQGQEIFASPLGIAFNAQNEMWVSDNANNKLMRLSPLAVPELKP